LNPAEVCTDGASSSVGQWKLLTGISERTVVERALPGCSRGPERRAAAKTALAHECQPEGVDNFDFRRSGPPGGGSKPDTRLPGRRRHRLTAMPTVFSTSQRLPRASSTASSKSCQPDRHAGSGSLGPPCLLRNCPARSRKKRSSKPDDSNRKSDGTCSVTRSPRCTGGGSGGGGRHGYTSGRPTFPRASGRDKK